jgi:hypothetical protein
MADLFCGLAGCERDTYKNVRMVAYRTDVVVPVCKGHYDLYYNEILDLSSDPVLEESSQNSFNKLYLQRIRQIFNKEKFT